jgi:hypothetical protein
MKTWFLSLAGLVLLTGCNSTTSTTTGSVVNGVLTAAQLYCSTPDGLKAPLGIEAKGATATYVDAMCAALGGQPVPLPGGNVAIKIVPAPTPTTT